MYKIGDIVLASGQIGTFFEIIHIEGETIWISDGHVQTKKTSERLKLVCKVENRLDENIPRIVFWDDRKK